MHRPDTEKEKQHVLLLSVACLGISSIITQMVTLREFFNVFSGNELTLGLVFGNWLLLTGLGAFLGRQGYRLRKPIRWVIACQLGIALLPPVQVILIRLLRNLFLPGLMVGLGDAFWSSLILLSPYCLISGFLLAVFSGVASPRREARQIGDVYVLDTTGALIGGVLFSFCLVHFFAPLQLVSFLLFLNLLAASYLAHVSRHQVMKVLALAALLLCAGLFAWKDLERLSAQAMYPGLELAYQESTPYGSLAVTRQGRQVNAYQNGVPIGSTHDPASAEETVHYALVQHPAPESVLLVSGGLFGAPGEVAKYPVRQLDYVELDPAVLELARKVSGLRDRARLRLIAADARQYVRSKQGAYDAILMALPDPSSAQLNRFYTSEFFAEVRAALRPNGVFSFSLSGAANYANPEVRLLASSVYRSLCSVFPEVLLIPGARQYFIASEAALSHDDIVGRLEHRGIETRFIPEYLSAKLTEDRLAEAREIVSAPAAENRDFLPGSYYAHLRFWLSQFGSSMLLPALLIGLLLVLIVGLLLGSPRRSVPVALCASGFAGMGLEVVLLIAFQVCYGYVYQQIGLIITAFMAGAALGALWAGRRTADASRLMFRLDALLAVVALLLAPGLLALNKAEGSFLQTLAPPILFPLATGLVGFLVGAQFPPAARLLFRKVEETAGNLYAFDLLGACLGALVIGTFCIPLLGIASTCLLLGGLKVMTAATLRSWPGKAPVVAVAPRAPTPVGRLFPFGLTMLAFIGIGAAIVLEETSTALYGFSFAREYHYVLLALLGLGILWAMGLRALLQGAGRVRAVVKAIPQLVFRWTRVRALRWINFLGFSLVVFYPVFRCYFKVPYLFCHVCPRKCVWGVLRPYLVPAALIMNLERRFWCYQACPIGTLFDCQTHAFRKPRRVPKFLRVLPVLVLIFTAVAYFQLEADFEAQPDVERDWYSYFYSNVFAVSAVVIGVAAVLIVLACGLWRTFCDTLCPVGAFSELLLKAERFFVRKARRHTLEKVVLLAEEREVPEPGTGTRQRGAAPSTEASEPPSSMEV